ncbi:hypothetical protein C8P68_102222 [Mucilaginibacter yixingensis]|uniref:Uncharacterized protein n=1 Tax=Mucilaginibacter yixingensis TaxID=1295612 RepID=A0A2T5JCB3_9SPHI|nr:hypothetical protein [Mucilaginibacter yixingensis]PTQ99401.1 hypothetical protein C8P68_102222 [Mucilaginibacter yixingensis]
MILCCGCQPTTQAGQSSQDKHVLVSVSVPTHGIEVTRLDHQYDDVTDTYQIEATIKNRTKAPISLQMIVHYLDANGKERAQSTGVTHHNIGVGESAAFLSVWFFTGVDNLPKNAKVSFEKL